LMDLWIVIDDVALIIGSGFHVVPMSGPPADTPAAPASGEGKALSLTSTTFARSVPHIVSSGMALITRLRYICAMSVVGVSEASEALGVGPQRVRAMLAAGRLEGRKVEGIWLVELPLQRDSRLRPRRRPMSSSQAWRAIAVLSDLPVEGDSSAASRLRARVREALHASHGEPESVAGLLRAWLRERAEPRRFHVPAVPVARMREDPRVRASGVSDARSPVRDAGVLEAYVMAGDVDEMARRYSMQPASEGAVLLHVVSDPVGARMLRAAGVPVAALAADLAENDDARSLAAAAQLVAEVVV
jgi:hypothetical protein